MAIPDVPVLARPRNRVIAWFETAGATAADHAIGYSAARPADRRVFDRMVKFGAIREAAPGLYWLDRVRLAHFRKEALAHVLGAVGIAGLAAAAAIAFGR